MNIFEAFREHKRANPKAWFSQFREESERPLFRETFEQRRAALARLRAQYPEVFDRPAPPPPPSPRQRLAALAEEYARPADLKLSQRALDALNRGDYALTAALIRHVPEEDQRCEKTWEKLPHAPIAPGNSTPPQPDQATQSADLSPATC